MVIIMFVFDPNKTYRMPPFFGGSVFDKNLEIKTYDCMSMNFTYKTDEKKLADYLPEGFELLKPELTISYNQLKGCEFLIGGGYNIIQVQVPARFHGKKDKMEGTFPLVIWENRTQPIIGGREENGQPKIGADILDIQVFKGAYFTNASHDGNAFLRMKMTELEPVDMQTLEQYKEGYKDVTIFGYRYIPKVGAPGADLCQPMIYPQAMNVTGAWSGNGNIEWIKMDSIYDFADVPINQYNIIKQLADLPIYELKPSYMVNGFYIMRPYTGRVIE